MLRGLSLSCALIWYTHTEPSFAPRAIVLGCCGCDDTETQFISCTSCASATKAHLYAVLSPRHARNLPSRPAVTTYSPLGCVNATALTESVWPSSFCIAFRPSLSPFGCGLLSYELGNTGPSGNEASKI